MKKITFIISLVIIFSFNHAVEAKNTLVSTNAVRSESVFMRDAGTSVFTKQSKINTVRFIQNHNDTQYIDAAPVASVTVLSPNGGEVYEAGQQLTVTWNANTYPANAIVNIALEFPDADGNSNSMIIPWVNTDNDGSETYTLPANTPTGQYGIFIQVKNPAGSSSPTVTTDRSDNWFTIRSTVQTCTITSYYAQTMTVHMGSRAYLHWTTNGCAHVFLNNTPVLANASFTTTPLFQATTMKLYASAQPLPAGCTSFVGYSPTTGMSCFANAVVSSLTITIQ